MLAERDGPAQKSRGLVNRMWCQRILPDLGYREWICVGKISNSPLACKWMTCISEILSPAAE